ncbi:glycoside hydrolase family 2 TIM barrel-domain containing protein [Gilvimarinus sp. SDUM040013]|uniref:Glycoside hydrolase family 2 TIM barrel-domain containing protein n=1 Tax=Gilvimarinus gilvus TaxID=3058038 RepID=A0ABU4S1P7_9GAMM|nr:glycoside hydrolase family 2 TIM barrel-domain containing protein [Gilvimarinus sp. SDUM040013]MDO3385473.1 glycoside hydrolase family 2 TIM barrel-domain containing protein [Gilvimarinus sp. SDUM040013]MDX6851110.1 glycoside hydrolase family 2 TIM barrel-domain containing protein [Gilvimarinus sp. SDUM040013]
MYKSAKLAAAAALAFCVSSVVVAESAGPKQVEIVKNSGVYQLLVNGEPFAVKGVGGSNIDTMELLVSVGGNSVRTWNAHSADALLAQAQKHGVMVALGFDTEKELHGFDYNDTVAVAEQFERFKATVDKYKNHPNLLAWVVANEPNLLFNEDGSLKDVNPRVYQSINAMIEYIHQNDPYHPVTYTFAGASEKHIKTALKYTPDVDFISVQLYGDVGELPRIIEGHNIDKPYMVTEYGAIGHWERPTTEWGREIEEPSGVKARTLAQRMNDAFAGNPTGKVIGSYAFLWGQKQERTPTWYGMFNADGKPNARVDELSRFWTGEYPLNRAPLAFAIRMNEKTATDSVYVAPGAKVRVEVDVKDPDSDTLEYQWVLLKEVQIRSQGGAFEQKPDAMDIAVVEEAPGVLVFQAPEAEGDYRIFSYTYDGKGKVGNANFPFYVKSN